MMLVSRVGLHHWKMQKIKTAPLAYFDKVHAAFELARSACGSIERYYTVGGKLVRLCFAGNTLISRFTPALDHLATTPTLQVDLTICLWDSASTGVQVPKPPWSIDALAARGEIQGYNDERFHTVIQAEGGNLHLFDSARKVAIYWLASIDYVPYWESSFPFRDIFHWWLPTQPYQPVHAGAVGLPSGGVLITGKSGSGKSTTCLSCLDSDLLYAGDDYVLVAADPAPTVYSLYNSAKLEPDNLERFPNLRSLVSNPHQLAAEKAVVYLQEQLPQKLISHFPIRAIILPRVTGARDTHLVPASPASSLIALAPTTLFHLPRANQITFAKLSSLVKQVPSYWLEAGTDLSQIPDMLLKFLRTTS
jgi:hypothetical protein